MFPLYLHGISDRHEIRLLFGIISVKTWEKYSFHSNSTKWTISCEFFSYPQYDATRHSHETIFAKTGPVAYYWSLQWDWTEKWASVLANCIIFCERIQQTGTSSIIVIEVYVLPGKNSGKWPGKNVMTENLWSPTMWWLQLDTHHRQPFFGLNRFPKYANCSHIINLTPLRRT